MICSHLRNHVLIPQVLAEQGEVYDLGGIRARGNARAKNLDD
jgi:hypothetical protein